MADTELLRALETLKAERLAPLALAGQQSVAAAADAQAMLRVALANEISVAELAATWIPTTPEVDVKIAFARQAGDEAGHFQLVSERLTALGFDPSTFTPPPDNALFAYLKTLTTTVQRIAAGLYALEAIAYAVNESFMAYCAHRGDDETVRVYREYIQPDERAHHELGKVLLAKYAVDAAQQAAARATVEQVFAIAAKARAMTAARLGSAAFPGC